MDFDFTDTPHGCLEEGTETQFGVIEAVSLTAYLIAGRWMPFRTVHGNPKPVEPLVTMTGFYHF
jgi:hypothetical protein